MSRLLKLALLGTALQYPIHADAQQNSVQLPEVAVEGQTRLPAGTEQTSAGPVNGYQALTSTSATGTASPIERVPQAIQVVPRKLIDDQSAQNIAEATRNVSSVIAVNPLQTPAYESTYIRGIAAEQWFDGMNALNNPGYRDAMAHIERIEVIKGLSSAISGGGQGSAFGGVINVISKKPVERAFAEFGLTVGSYRHIQPYFDVNTPLNAEKTVLFRMTGEFAASNSQIGVIDTRRYSINPSLLFTNKEGTSLLVQGRFSEWSGQEYQGLPATGTLTGGFRINPNLFIGPADVPRSYSRVQSVSAKLDHAFNEIWSGQVQARILRTEFAEYAQNNYDGFAFNGNVPSFGSTWALMNIALFQRLTEATVGGHMKAEWNAGPAKNTMMFGADYSSIKDDGVMLGNAADLFALSTDLTAPTFPAYVEPANIAANTFVDGNNRYVTRGVQAQWQSTLWNRLHLLGGLRVANIKIDSVSPVFGLSSATDVTKVLPRVGVGLDIIQGVTAYASYSEGMRGVPYAFYTSTPRPEETKQKEAGIKINLSNGLSGTLAVFEIERTGVPVTVGFTAEPIGEVRSRGFEADLLWQPNHNWQILASYAHVDSNITRDLSATALAGNFMNIVPRDSGRLWANYRFDGSWNGWSIGAGIYASSGAFVDLANLYKTDPYFTIDAKIAYETQKYSVALSMKNLTDQQYFVPYNYLGGRVATGQGRTVYLKMSYKLQ